MPQRPLISLRRVEEIARRAHVFQLVVRHAPPREAFTSSGARHLNELAAMSLPSRADAIELMHEFTVSESLRKHMLSVEVAMRAYAEKSGEDVERWGLAGLIHDFDYERFPNAAHSATEEHPAEGVRLLRERGWPEDILDAIMGHALYTETPRITPMSKTLFAVDELTGLITATSLVRPSRSVHEVDARSVRKKMKDKAFARGVSRDDVINGAADLGVDLDEHIAFVIGAMQRSADALGLAGTAAPGAA